MKKPKNPGRKPTKEDYTYPDHKTLDTCFELQNLIDDGFVEVEVQAFDEMFDIIASSKPYFHNEAYENALSKWELLSEKWNEWLSSEDGIKFQLKEKEQKAKIKEKSDREKQSRIEALKKELARLEKK